MKDEKNKIINTEEIALFTEEAVLQFLKSSGKGSNSKDYEFLLAVILLRFLQTKWKEPCRIGLKIDPKYKEKYPNGSFNILDIVDAIRNGLEENNPIDFYICKGEGQKVKSQAFQVKRFGIEKGEKNLTTDDLIDFLNKKIRKKYTEIPMTKLFVALEPNINTIDFGKVKEMVDTRNYPFTAIMFGWQKGNDIFIGEIYPSFCMDKFNINDFFN
jgi:hypothetical protein